MKFGSLTVSSERSKRSASNAGAAHAVKKGDTLYSIAKKYGVSVADIVKANNIKNNHIEIGEKLVIPTKTVEKPTTVVKTAKKANVFGNGIVKDAPSLSNKEATDKDVSAPAALYKSAGVHYVKAGDTFEKIEKLYGFSKGELRNYSTNSKLTNLKAGNKVQLPERVQVRNISTKNDVARALGISTGFIDHMESIEKKRNRLYDDGAGNATVGIGHHAFGSFEKKFYKNRTLSNKEIYQLLAKDLAKARNTIIKSIGQDAYDKLSTNQKEALIDYVFNRGKDAFRSDDCAPLRSALKNGQYEKAAIHMYTPNTLKNDSTRLGVSKRRLYEIHHFCGGKITPRVQKRVQQLYNAGLQSSSARNDSTLAGHNKEVKELFGNKIKLKSAV